MSTAAGEAGTLSPHYRAVRGGEAGHWGTEQDSATGVNGDDGVVPGTLNTVV